MEGFNVPRSNLICTRCYNSYRKAPISEAEAELKYAPISESKCASFLEQNILPCHAVKDASWTGAHREILPRKIDFPHSWEPADYVPRECPVLLEHFMLASAK